MCVNQKCMPVASLRKSTPTCVNNCNGNGVCNSLGHCHCKEGYAPPYCDYPGPGGSEDSGPASDPSCKSQTKRKKFLKSNNLFLARKSYVTAMFIIFLGIIPATGLICYLAVYTGYYYKFSWKKPPSTYVHKNSPKNYFSCARFGVGACSDICACISVEQFLQNNNERRQNRVNIPNISQRVTNTGGNLNRRLEITRAELISTTNNEIINSSSTICLKSLDNEEQNLKIESGRRMSFKNIKSLKLNTNLKYAKQKNDSNRKSKIDTPSTSSTVVSPDFGLSVKNLAKQFEVKTNINP